MQWKTLSSLVQQDNNGKQIAIPQDLFRQLLINSLREKAVFDEASYVSNNSDVANAVQKQLLASAADHYYKAGYFEGRQPKDFIVDEKYYLAQNPDVVGAIRSGIVKSAQQHFDDRGFKEGRAPFAGFSLF